MEDPPTLDILARLTRDGSAQVRKTLFSITSQALTTLRDRYGYAPKLLWILIAGLVDDVDGVREECEEWVDRVGARYEEDYAAEVKDELDYVSSSSGTLYSLHL